MKAWNDTHKRLPMCQGRTGVCVLKTSKEGMAQGRPFLAALKQGQAGREVGRELMRGQRIARLVTLQREQ